MLVDVKCEECGADLQYKPGTTGLTCNYCQHEMVFDAPEEPLEAHQELDLEDYLNRYDENSDHVERHVISCNNCGAETEFDPNKQSGNCAFCDTPLIVTQAQSKRLIKPKSLLPFQIESSAAKERFIKWVQKLWFAPNDLKKQSTQLDKFNGIYLPYWTYDCDTYTRYTGQRGDYYYVTETRKDSDGKTISERVRKTRWRFTSGQVSVSFDDVLVPASKSLPRKKLYELEPWDLPKLVDYQDEYLSGYIAESYQIDLKEGYTEAKKIMADTIDGRVCRDIGGDEQRVISATTQYSGATFKHLLLPVWVSAYRYKDKLYQILVNGRTGEVQGERPYSWVKITFAVLATAAVIAGVVYLIQSNQ